MSKKQKQLDTAHWGAEKVINGLADQALTNVMTPVVMDAMESPAVKRRITQAVNQHLDWLLRPTSSEYSKGPVDRLVDARVNDLINQAIHEALRRHAKTDQRDNHDPDATYNLLHLQGMFREAAQQRVDEFLANHTDIIDGIVTKFLQVLKTGKIPRGVQSEITDCMWNWFFTKLEKRFDTMFGDEE